MSLRRKQTWAMAMARQGQGKREANFCNLAGRHGRGTKGLLVEARVVLLLLALRVRLESHVVKAAFIASSIHERL